VRGDGRALVAGQEPGRGARGGRGRAAGGRRAAADGAVGAGGQRGGEQPVHDHVRVAPDGRREVRVHRHRQRVVPCARPAS